MWRLTRKHSSRMRTTRLLTEEGSRDGCSRRGRQLSRRGASAYKFARFCEKTMKLRKFWSVVGPGAPPWIHNWGGCGAMGGVLVRGLVLSRRGCAVKVWGGGAVHNSKGHHNTPFSPVDRMTDTRF